MVLWPNFGHCTTTINVWERIGEKHLAHLVGEGACQPDVCNCSVLLIIMFLWFLLASYIVYSIYLCILSFSCCFCESVYLAAWLLHNSKWPVTQYPIPAITILCRMRYSRHKRSWISYSCHNESPRTTFSCHKRSCFAISPQ